MKVRTPLGYILFYLATFLAFILGKLGLVSKEALEGQETRGIRVAKYTVLILVVGFMLWFAFGI